MFDTVFQYRESLYDRLEDFINDDDDDNNDDDDDEIDDDDDDGR